MRTMMDCAWMLDGATKDRAYALSLASRCGWMLLAYMPTCMIENDENMNMHGLESTPHSKFHELPKIESIRWITEPIRFHPVFKLIAQNALIINSSSSESILKRRNM
ncbi:hypothetical protein PIB30_075171, partial [Stylosanthes scabra]|nr:hypothetical protein [Stylosanthes scabra]